MYRLWGTDVTKAVSIYLCHTFLTLTMDNTCTGIEAVDETGYYNLERPSVQLQPQHLGNMYTDSKRTLQLRCMLPPLDTADKTRGSKQNKIFLHVYLNCANKVIPILKTRTNVTVLEETDESFAIATHCNQSLFISVHANIVGRCSLFVQASRSENFTIPGQTFQETSIDITILRKVRMHDIAYEVIMAVISLFVSLSVGCSSETANISVYYHHPSPVIVAGFCQYILVPLLALALSKVAGLEEDLSLGLLLAATTPGGGIGHLFSTITGGSVSLSIVLNIMAFCLPLVCTPVWLLSLGHLVKSKYTTISYGRMSLWQLCASGCFVIGIMIRHRFPKGADAFLNWLAKPLLLFTFILYITLGLYINFYMLLVLSSASVLTILSLSCLTYVFALLLASCTKQTQEFSKVIAIESSMPNCSLSLTIARLAFHQPAGDIASTIPMILLVSCTFPMFLEIIFKKLWKFVKEKCSQPSSSNDSPQSVPSRKEEDPCNVPSQQDVTYLSTMDMSVSHVSPSKPVQDDVPNNTLQSHLDRHDTTHINCCNQDTRL